MRNDSKFEIERDVDCEGFWLYTKTPHGFGKESTMFVPEKDWDLFVEWVQNLKKYRV